VSFLRIAILPLAAVVLIAGASCSGRSGGLPESFSIVSAEQLVDALASQRGRVVVLNLWATWCEPCREEFPALVRLDENYRDAGVTVIGLSVDEPDEIESEVRPFIEQVNARFTILVKDYGDPMHFIDALSPRLSGALPETIVYGRDGGIVTILSGKHPYEVFAHAVQQAL
jgi:thiol-disulfide isomerase/thioredoxin